jgi:hypothetical protein
MQVTMFLADAANVSIDGKLNVLGIFTQILSQAFPARHPAMVFVAKIALDIGEKADERTLEILLLDEDSHETGVKIGGTIKFERNDEGLAPEVNMIIPLHLVEFKEAGLYEFVLLINGDRKASTPLRVSQLVAQS